ncbi:MAG: helix-turn-helix domain-containing protein [Bacteroidota bacterium]|nr:helix-turn-helix domain-containing protein [Bacteroidota bacterium]
MIFKHLPTSAALSQYIRNYQLIHFVFDNNTEKPIKPYPPRPEQCIIFYPRDPLTIEYQSTQQKILQPRSIISGQVVTQQNLHIGNDYIVLKVIFYPGALYHFIQMPLTEITDGNIDAESVFSKEMRLVNERLNSTDNLEGMVLMVEDFLLRMISKSKSTCNSMDAIARILMHQPDKFSLDFLADQSCLSTRQFQRRFKERVGVSPKLFARLSRFDKAFRLKYYKPNLDWLQIAIETGYHDYQHLVKDFTEFADVLPNNLIQEESRSPECYFGFRE